MWDSSGFWQKSSLCALGLVVSLGHDGFDCPVPSRPACLTVFHTNGLHAVNVVYCNCNRDFSNSSKYIQLLRAQWFPASQSQPATAFTREVLDLFHALTVQGKLSAHDFYSAVVRLKDNVGYETVIVSSSKAICRTLFIPNLQTRYNEFLRASRCYRHLLLAKRAGRGHDPSGIENTQAGQLALDCPACPHPGKNLPEGWESLPKEKQ